MTYKCRKIGYLRVSRRDQCLDRQIDGLEETCDELRLEHISAASKVRPVFDQLIQDLNAGDSLVVWDLDRAFRSTIDAISHAEALTKRNIGFRILTLNVDTQTPDGMLIYTIMAAMAEHERRQISKRTKEGLEAARRRGVRLGRPPCLKTSS
jgi:DNA invertase Pin-like site-specific DNA recombinase